MDFLLRFVEYLAWSPKYVIDAANAVTSGADIEARDVKKEYLSAMDDRKGLVGQYNALELAESDGLKEVLQTRTRLGICYRNSVDTSRSELGQYSAPIEL